MGLLLDISFPFMFIFSFFSSLRFFLVSFIQWFILFVDAFTFFLNISLMWFFIFSLALVKESYINGANRLFFPYQVILLGRAFTKEFLLKKLRLLVELPGIFLAMPYFFLMRANRPILLTIMKVISKKRIWRVLTGVICL